MSYDTSLEKLRGIYFDRECLWDGVSMILNPDQSTPETILSIIEKQRPTLYRQILNYL